LSEKENKWKKIKEFFEDRAEQEPPTIEHTDLQEQGVTILADGKLEHRIGLYLKLQSELKQTITTNNLDNYLKELKQRLDLVHYAVCEIAGPYACAGSDKHFEVKLRGWTSWYALASSILLAIEDWIKQEQEDKAYIYTKQYGQSTFLNRTANLQTLVRSLHIALELHVFRDAFKVLNYCFQKEDVRPRSATVIHTIASKKHREDMTSDSDFGD